MLNYDFLNLEQGSQEWKNHRLKSLTSTDSSIIMGLNKYENIRDLYLIKTGQKSGEKELNAAIINGTNKEEHVRRLFTQATGIGVKPACVANKEHPFIMSSLDGITDDGLTIAELKAPSHFFTFKQNKTDLPGMYFAQIQHHLLAAEGTKTAWFASWHENNGLYLEEYKIDLIFRKELISRLKMFKNIVDNQLDFDDNEFPPFDLSYILNKHLI